LDNACVDFRYQRCGIGKQLLQWGLDIAREKKLSVVTEASPQGLGLYTKLGMKQVGWLEPKTGENEEEMKMPVLRLNWPEEI
jgi:ribosomal protein S18 acetylase RimI-like enzyme